MRYRLSEEKAILLHYADKMRFDLAKTIILKGAVDKEKGDGFIF